MCYCWAFVGQYKISSCLQSNETRLFSELVILGEPAVMGTAMVLSKWGPVLLSCVQLFVTEWAVACQTSLSMGFPRHEYWSELPFPLQGIFLTQGLNQHLLLGRRILYHWATRKAPTVRYLSIISICLCVFQKYSIVFIFRVLHTSC